MHRPRREKKKLKMKKKNDGKRFFAHLAKNIFLKIILNFFFFQKSPSLEKEKEISMVILWCQCLIRLPNKKNLLSVFWHARFLHMSIYFPHSLTLYRWYWYVYDTHFIQCNFNRSKNRVREFVIKKEERQQKLHLK